MSDEPTGPTLFLAAKGNLELATEKAATDAQDALVQATIANTQATLALIDLLSYLVPTLNTRGGLFKVDGLAEWKEALGR